MSKLELLITLIELEIANLEAERRLLREKNSDVDRNSTDEPLDSVSSK